MRRPLAQTARRALMALFVVVVAPVGFGCQCNTAQTETASRLGQASEPVECPRSVQGSLAAEGSTATEQVMSDARQAAIARAEGFIELVEYKPASMGSSKALAILSYPQAEKSLGRRSFIYDDALALLWFAWTGQADKAAGLAETLMYLQNPDGSWGFSFDTENVDSYHASYVRSGTVAWAAHALGYYGEHFARPRAIRAARRAARFLRQVRIGGDSMARGLVSAGYGTPSTPPDAPPGPTLPYAVSEHQFDAQVVLARYEPRTAKRLAERMNEVLWMPEEDRFAVAASTDRINTRRALDAAGAWGALWLLSTGERERAEQSYRFAREHFVAGGPGAKGGQLFGFRPYEDPIDGYDPSQAKGHIFVEGSMSMGLAAHRLGDRQTADKLLATGIELSCRGEPGLAYSNVEVPGFSTRPAAASTLWFLFFEREMARGQLAPLFISHALVVSNDLGTTG